MIFGDYAGHQALAAALGLPSPGPGRVRQRQAGPARRTRRRGARRSGTSGSTARTGCWRTRARTPAPRRGCPASDRHNETTAPGGETRAARQRAQTAGEVAHGGSTDGTMGLTLPLPGMALPEHREIVDELESLGYTDAWSAEMNGDRRVHPAGPGRRVVGPELRLGTAIAGIYTRGPAPAGDERGDDRRAGARPVRARRRHVVAGDRGAVERHPAGQALPAGP